MTDKRASVVLRLPEAPALNSSYLRTRYLQLNYIFLAPTQHTWDAATNAKTKPTSDHPCERKHMHKVATHLATAA